MSDQEYYNKRQNHLARVTEFAEQVEGTVLNDETRLLFMGNMPERLQQIEGKRPTWEYFKHKLFMAVYWLVRETDQD